MLQYATVVSPVPAEGLVAIVHTSRYISTEVHEPSRAEDDGLIRHVTLFREGREAECFTGIGDTAPADLQDHPERFRGTGYFTHPLRVVADDADVFIRQVGVGAGRISDWVNVDRAYIVGR